MAPIFIDPDAKPDWVFPEDRNLPKEDQAVMHLRVPAINRRNEIERQMLKNSGDSVAFLAMAPDVCAAVLAGWTCKLPDGRTPPFVTNENGEPTEETLGWFTLAGKNALMVEGMRVMGLSAQAKGEEPILQAMREAFEQYDATTTKTSVDTEWLIDRLREAYEDNASEGTIGTEDQD